MLLTGCRLSEIQFLRWEYVKDDCIELPDAKTGGRVVPLGPEAHIILAGLFRGDDNPWVFAGRLGAGWGLVPEGFNPCRSVEKYPERSRERFLTDAEFTRLGRVLDEVPDPPRRRHGPADARSCQEAYAGERAKRT